MGECECFVMQMLYFWSCVHPVVEDARGAIWKRHSRSHNCLVGSHECLLLFTSSCCSECFYDLFCVLVLRSFVCTVCEFWVLGKTQNLWLCYHG